MASEYTNGEVKVMLSNICGFDPEDIESYVIVLLKEGEGIQVTSGCSHDPTGRYAEQLMLLHAVAKIGGDLAGENASYREVLLNMGWSPPEGATG